VCYDGSSFAGWAAQEDERTVQGTLEDALGRLTGKRTIVCAASRTDSGVHAMGQVVNFKTASTIPVKKVPRALQALLPDDIVIVRAAEGSPAFDARRQAKKKLYSYMIVRSDVVTPAIRRTSWILSGDLDVAAMRRAAKEMTGKHDFTSFTVTDKRRKLGDPFRRIYSIRLKLGSLKEFYGGLAGGLGGRALKIDFSGDGFLYKMVRSIVGTLVDVGRGRISPDDIGRIFGARRRSSAGRTAPSRGLTLIKVYY